jgi:hypothetical protein
MSEEKSLSFLKKYNIISRERYLTIYQGVFMKKSFLLTVVMILMFSVVSFASLTISGTVLISGTPGIGSINIEATGTTNGKPFTPRMSNLTTASFLISNIPDSSNITIMPINFDKNSYCFTPESTIITTKNSNITSLSFKSYFKITEVKPSKIIRSNMPIINNYSNILSYNLTKTCFVSIAYYDLQGKVIGRFVNKEQNAGDYSIPIMNYAGTYLQVFKAGNYKKTDKITLR